MCAAVHLSQVTPWHVCCSRSRFIVPWLRWRVLEGTSIRHVPGVGIHSSPGLGHAPRVGIHSSPGLVASAGWQFPARVSSPWARVEAALCSALCLLCSWWNLEHQREEPTFCLPALDTCKGTCWHQLKCHTHSAAIPKKAQILMLGYSTLGSEGEQSLLALLVFHIPSPTSYTEAPLIQSSLYVPFLRCFPNDTTQLSTTACAYDPQNQPLYLVMYLHLLLPGFWRNNFLLLTSPFGLGWLKSLPMWAVLAWAHTLLFQLDLPTAASKGSGCFPPACKVSNMRYPCHCSELVNKKLNQQGNPEHECINSSIW